MAEIRTNRRLTREEYEQAGILPEALDTLMDTINWLDENPERTTTEYGHGVGMLAQVIATGENQPLDEQRKELRKKALYLLEKYGDHIIEFMRPELRESLGLVAKE